MDRFFTSSNPYIDDENSATTELEGEVDTDDEGQEEETPEDKSDETTTGKEVMSVDNITDEKDTAEKVEARSEQIVDKREETEEAEKAEEEKEEGGEDGDTSEEGDSEKSEDGNEPEGEKDKGEDTDETDETEEVSKESYEYLKGLGVDLSKVKVSVDISQEGFGSPECIHQDNSVTPPVEVTQGEATGEEIETKENPYEPSLDAIVKMSKFQEGERDFNVKSADDWS